MALPSVALASPFVVPAMALVQGLWRGARHGGEHPLDFASQNLADLADGAKSVEGWLDRVADKVPKCGAPSLLEAGYLSLGDLIASPLQPGTLSKSGDTGRGKALGLSLRANL